MKMRYELPTRPLTLIDAVNRCFAATGSPRLAMAASSADYNGHWVSVTWNSYRRYWIAEYFWGGRVVLSRGSLEGCLEAAKAEYDRGAKGGRVVFSLQDPGVRGLFDDGSRSVMDASIPTLEQQAELAGRFGFVAAPDEDPRPDPNSLFSEVGDACRLERQWGIPATSFLISSKDLTEYRANVDEAFADRRQNTLHPPRPA